MKTEFNLNGINITVHADKDYLELIEHKACNQLEYHNPTDYGSLYRIMKSKNIKERLFILLSSLEIFRLIVEV